MSLDGSVDAFPEVEIMGWMGAEAREFWPELGSEFGPEWVL